MELQLLHFSPIPSYCPPKFTFRKHLRCRRNVLNAGIPNIFFENTRKNANRFVILNSASESGDAETAVVVEKPPTKPRRFEVFPGHPTPFGATVREGGVNFAVYSSNASSATLCLISISDLREVD